MSSASRRFQRWLGFRPYFFTPASQLTTTVSGGNSASAPGAVEIRKRLPSAPAPAQWTPEPPSHAAKLRRGGLTFSRYNLDQWRFTPLLQTPASSHLRHRAVYGRSQMPFNAARLAEISSRM